MEDHADRQSGFDRDVRVRTLAAGLAAGRSPPGIECLIRKPDGHVATTPKAGLVLRPIPYPILRLRVLVLASLRILHRWRLRVRGFSLQRNLDHEPCTNAPPPGGPGQHRVGLDALDAASRTSWPTSGLSLIHISEPT